MPTCTHPDHVDGTSCEDRAVGCAADCDCCVVFDEDHDACADCGRQIRHCSVHGWEHAADHRCFIHGPRCDAPVGE